MKPRIRSTLALTVASVALISACSNDSGADQPATNTSTDSEPTTNTRTADGVLRIGVLLPPRSLLDGAQHDDVRAVMESAARAINSSRSPGFPPVEIVFSDESSDVEASRVTVTALVDDGIDALIGPVSSDIAGAVVRDVTAAGVGVCSPASTSILMSKVVDDGLMIRTAPTDQDIARAMAEEIDARGYNKAAVFYPDTAYGLQFFEFLSKLLTDSGLNLTTEGLQDDSLFFPYEPSAAGFAEAVTRLPELAPKINLVIGDASVADEALGSFAAQEVIVNDGFANVVVSPTDAEDFLRVSAAFDGFAIDAFDGVERTVTTLLERDPDLQLQTDGRIPLLANFVDCLNVIALSSLLAESELASDFMSQASIATTRGSTCRSFTECAEIHFNTLNFDYDGWGRNLDLDEGGNVVNGPLLAYGLDPSGVMVFQGRFESES